MEFSKGEIIAISSITTFIIMFVVIYVQWRIEKETNNSNPMFVFHVFNVLTMMMFYGVTYMSFTLYMGPFSYSGGAGKVLLNSTVYPFPFIVTVYFIATRIYYRHIRPVMKVKGTNVVVMRRNWRRKK